MVSVTPSPAAVTDDQTRSKPLISDEDWPKIEAYGHKLSAGIKLEILRVTTSFVMFEPFERAALPSAEAEKRVQSIRDSAGKFFSDLLSGPSNDATTSEDKLIDRYDRWICDLTTILAPAGLPVAASKGSGESKSDSPSAFVSLVLKLQDCVPKEARRHTTPDGLATAINRARKGLGSKSGCLPKKK